MTKQCPGSQDNHSCPLCTLWASGTVLPARAAATTLGREHVVMVSSRQAEQKQQITSQDSYAFIVDMP